MPQLQEMYLQVPNVLKTCATQDHGAIEYESCLEGYMYHNRAFHDGLPKSGSILREKSSREPVGYRVLMGSVRGERDVVLDLSPACRTE